MRQCRPVLCLTKDTSYSYTDNDVRSSAILQEEFMDRMTIAKRLQQSIVTSSVLGILVISAIVACISIIPFYNTLKDEQETTLSSVVHMRATAIEEYLTRMQDIAAQITSRTRIREALEEYNQGAISREELVSFSQPKLAEALSMSPEIAGMLRFDQNGTPVIAVGQPIPAKVRNAVHLDASTSIVYEPLMIGDTLHVAVSAPIANPQGTQAGTDLVLFDLSRLHDIVADQGELATSSQTFLACLHYAEDAEDPTFNIFLSTAPAGPANDATHETLIDALEQSALYASTAPAIDTESIDSAIVGHSQIGESMWVLAVLVDAQELYAPVYRQIEILVVVIVGLVAAAMFGMIRLLKPLTGAVILHTGELETEIASKTAYLQAEIAERARAEEALRQSQELLQRYVEYSPGIIHVRDPLGRFLLVNQHYASLLGLEPEQMIGQADADLFPPEIVEEWHTHDQQVRESGEPVVYETSIPLQQGNSTYLVAQFPLYDNHGSLYAIGGISTDITERKAAESQLHYRALHDELTGLPNRAQFLATLKQTMDHTRKYGGSFAVLFLDLDDFKNVNDSLGHLDGDQLLVTMARRLEASLPLGSIVARFGGDEFVVLLKNTPTAIEATAISRQLQTVLMVPVQMKHYEMVSSVSVGIVLGSDDYEQPSDVLRDADAALYTAKRRGPGYYAVFDSAMRTSALTRLYTKAALHRALEQQELRVYYQPIVDMATAHIVGFEALLRWHHPERGIVPPGEFIPLAEETGLMVPIGWWVLGEACRQLQEWHQRFPQLRPLTINVNLSANEIGHTSVIEKIHQIVEQTGLDAQHLRLEITESMLMDNTEATLRTLRQLRSLGVHLCIDDFGTGYSSLRYLHRFPIQVLKIDRSFVHNLEDAESLAITQSVIMLSHNLGIEVVAEGIETVEQLALLQHLQCEYGQGFLFARPIPSPAAEALLAAGEIDYPTVPGNGHYQAMP
jgi:diguanylate cyclase (GGDEF)-like protein/PAS domain S-box-containing protein